MKGKCKSDSLCWDCARAYSRPDPEGCGFHRAYNRWRYLEHCTFILKWSIVDCRFTSHDETTIDQMIQIDECKHFREGR